MGSGEGLVLGEEEEMECTEDATLFQGTSLAPILILTQSLCSHHTQLLEEGIHSSHTEVCEVYRGTGQDNNWTPCTRQNYVSSSTPSHLLRPSPTSQLHGCA